MIIIWYVIITLHIIAYIRVYIKHADVNMMTYLVEKFRIFRIFICALFLKIIDKFTNIWSIFENI